jgi:hypothetical protein
LRAFAIEILPTTSPACSQSNRIPRAEQSEFGAAAPALGESDGAMRDRHRRRHREAGAMTRSAAALLGDTRDEPRVELIDGMPGESCLAITDTLIVCRHESAVARSRR